MKFRNAILLIGLILFTGCRHNDSLQKKYGNDSQYFAALRALSNNDKKTAARLFKSSAKNGSSIISRKSQEELCSLGSVSERVKNLEILYDKYSDEKSLKMYLKELYDQKEFGRIILKTKDIDLASCDNTIAFYRIDSLLKRGDAKFRKEFFDWCVLRSWTSEHYKIYCSIKLNPSDKNDKLIEFRSNVWTKNFSAVLETATELLKDRENFYQQILSDAGKVFLYASSDSLKSAFFIDSILFDKENEISNDCAFYLNFYAGRLYDKADNYRTRALNRFSDAMKFAGDNLQKKDNALWYYLNTQLKVSISATISSINKYKTDFSSPDYFDDFFDTLSVRLLSKHLWKEFYSVTKIIQGYASKEVCAKYSYISARLMQQNFLLEEKSDETIENLFRSCLNRSTDLYYRLLSIKELGFDDEETFNCLLEFGKPTEYKINPDVEIYLNGLCDFGFSERVYSAWEEYGDFCGYDCAYKLSDFLKASGHYTQSLRIASRRANYPDSKNYKSMLCLAFPKNWNEYIEETCGKFNQNEELLYALIRSESFFNSQVVSHAGAIGLTQLMESTGADIARKLKYAEYDLKDARTNILFGSFYLEELCRRLDGSKILAVLSYNGGISRVRSWIKSASLEFGVQNVQKDLFVESLPFEETREYGRKVLSACCMYGYLYYNKSTSKVIEDFMQ